MGTKEVTMEVKYAAMFASVQSGKESVSELCARLGMSRKSYYKYLVRFRCEGLEGLRPRSRRPLRSPTATPSGMVELITKARSDLAAEGWDNGALSIFYRLLRGGEQPPASRTIHRVLVRQGLVEPQPKKRPRSSYRRFEFPAPDDCWQIDAFDYLLVGGASATVFEVKDDCSRTQIANLAWTAEDTMGAWECLARGIDEFGKPYLLLSDNSLAFSGRAHNRIVLAEKNLMALGIKPITSSPHHPQTCGKNERGHQTLQKWLAAQPAAATLSELQALLDRYQRQFNNRVHQGLDPNQTPLERRIAAARRTPIQVASDQPTLVRHCTAKHGGFIDWEGLRIAVGRELGGHMLLVFATGDHLLIFFRHHLVRDLILDRTRRYQGLRRPRRRDHNRDQLQLELQTHPKLQAPRGSRGRSHPAPNTLPRGAAEAPRSRAAPGRRPAIATATLESGEAAPLHSARRHPTTNQLSPMS
jgi:leucine-zipper of insertion element IS481/Integrase core domain